MNATELQNILNKENVVVFFYADWCGGCKVASPIVQKLATKLNFRLIKIQEDNDLEEQFAVDYYPHVIISYKGLIKHYPGLQMINDFYESLI